MACEPPGDWQQVHAAAVPPYRPTHPYHPRDPQPQSVSAALGYLLLLVDKVAFIMGGPVLHEALPQGSTSSIWMPGSFWDRAPRRQEHVLPLYIAGAAGGAGGGGVGGAVATLARGGSGGSAGGSGGGGYARQGGGGPGAGGGGFWQMALGGGGGRGPAPSGGSDGGVGYLMRTSSDTSGGGGGGTPRALGLLSSRRDADTQAAFALLQRSLACFLRDKAAASSLQLPAAWNPLAWLVVFCAVVKRDAKADGKLVAASLGADAAAAAAAAAAASAASSSAPSPQPGGGSGRQQQQQQQQQQRRGEGRASRDGGLDPGSVMALLEGGGAGQQLQQQMVVTGPWDGAWAFDGAPVVGGAVCAQPVSCSATTNPPSHQRLNQPTPKKPTPQATTTTRRTRAGASSARPSSRRRRRAPTTSSTGRAR